MGECCCSCCNCDCHKSSSIQDEDDSAEKWFLTLADEAWAEVLKDKMKEYILDNQEKHIKELAKIVAEANHEKWRSDMKKEEGNNEFKENLHSFFRKKGS